MLHFQQRVSCTNPSDISVQLVRPPWTPAGDGSLPSVEGANRACEVPGGCSVPREEPARGVCIHRVANIPNLQAAGDLTTFSELLKPEYCRGWCEFTCCTT